MQDPYSILGVSRTDSDDDILAEIDVSLLSKKTGF